MCRTHAARPAQTSSSLRPAVFPAIPRGSRDSRPHSAARRSDRSIRCCAVAVSGNSSSELCPLTRMTFRCPRTWSAIWLSDASISCGICALAGWKRSLPPTVDSVPVRIDVTSGSVPSAPFISCGETPFSPAPASLERLARITLSTGSALFGSGTQPKPPRISPTVSSQRVSLTTCASDLLAFSPGGGFSTQSSTNNPIMHMIRSASVKIHSGHSSQSSWGSHLQLLAMVHRGDAEEAEITLTGSRRDA